MFRKIRVVISKEKQSEESFMVALVPALAFPDGANVWDQSSGCSVQAINHNDDLVWSYIHLDAQEKNSVGDALSDSCVDMNKWYWCQMFDNLP